MYKVKGGVNVSKNQDAQSVTHLRAIWSVMRERGILGVGGKAEDGLILVLVLSLLIYGMSIDSEAAQSSAKASDLEGKAYPQARGVGLISLLSL